MDRICIFAGFPTGLTPAAPALNGSYPVAFVKKAVMSGEVKENALRSSARRATTTLVFLGAVR